MSIAEHCRIFAVTKTFCNVYGKRYQVRAREDFLVHLLHSEQTR
jgi:hypothetical protein